MKRFLYPIACLAFVAAVSSCNMAGNDDYENLSNDMCACVNESSKGVSKEMKDAFVDAEKSGKNVESIVSDMAAKDPTKAMEDATALMELGTKMEKCGADLEKKYKDIYTTDSEKQVQDKLIAALKDHKDCAFTYAIIKLGMSAK